MIVEITSLSQVILFEFQRTAQRSMTLGEIMVACTRAAPHLPNFFYEDSLAGRNFFTKEVIRHLHQLAEVYGLLGINWIVNGKKIDKVAVTPKGIVFLRDAEFRYTWRADHWPTKNHDGKQVTIPLPFAS